MGTMELVNAKDSIEKGILMIHWPGCGMNQRLIHALKPAWVTSRQVEVGRGAVTRNVRRGEKIWVGTPICIRQSLVDIGRIASIKNNDKPVDYAKKGQKVYVKLCDRLGCSTKVAALRSGQICWSAVAQQAAATERHDRSGETGSRRRCCSLWASTRRHDCCYGLGSLWLATGSSSDWQQQRRLLDLLRSAAAHWFAGGDIVLPLWFSKKKV
ncbi:Translation Initiation Factor 5B [Datura stramonium]|uniref:Translation Initiation Factor 5B n=1 Tax=Datura stramonium TaxID=4076 RepID=A0ABS8VM99_DATST|nr:Translation Initiation Factor 5B [Datura stramonium]